MFLVTSSLAVERSYHLKSVLLHIYIVLNQPYLPSITILFFGLKEVSSHLAEKPALGLIDEIMLRYF